MRGLDGEGCEECGNWTVIYSRAEEDRSLKCFGSRYFNRLIVGCLCVRWVDGESARRV